MLAYERRGAPGLLRTVSAAALGVLVAAIQLVPSWALLPETSRGAGIAPADAAQWAFHPLRLFEFVVPGLFAGRPGPTPAEVYLWLDGPTQYPLPFLQSVFVGLPVLLCAAWGWKTSRAARWGGVAAVVLFWLALGQRAFASQALSWVPVWGSFRYAEKLIGPVTLLLAVLAGLGLPAFAGRGMTRLRNVRWPLAGACAALAAFVFVAGRTMPGPPSWPTGISAIVDASRRRRPSPRGHDAGSDGRGSRPVSGGCRAART